MDYTPIPGYIIDEKDLIGYNAKGEKVVLKNQTAYYKAVTCNRTENDDFFNVLGTCSDMNGDVGRQWLALYAVKNELMEHVLASSLVAKVFAKSGDVKIPDGYETGIHMFGSDAPFNLNSSLYDWANDAPGVYIYFKTESASASTSGTNYSTGVLAITGGAGAVIGAVVTSLLIKAKRKNSESKAKTD